MSSMTVLNLDRLAKVLALLAKHAAFVRDIRERLYRDPHLGLSTGETRSLNMLWRAWRVTQERTADD